MRTHSRRARWLATVAIGLFAGGCAAERMAAPPVPAPRVEQTVIATPTPIPAPTAAPTRRPARRPRSAPRPSSTAMPVGATSSEPVGGEPAPGLGRIELVPTFDGTPLDATLDLPVSVRLFSRSKQLDAGFESTLTNGTIALEKVETGVYGVTFSLDTTAAGGLVHGLPITRLASIDAPPLPLLGPGQTLRTEIPMLQMVELLEPERAARPHGPERLTLPSPLRVSWKPVPGARRYTVETVQIPARALDGPPRRTSAETTKTRWSGTLPSTAPDDTYILVVTAIGTRAPVAKTLFTFGVTQ